jgi:hypothetical protein
MALAARLTVGGGAGCARSPVACAQALPRRAAPQPLPRRGAPQLSQLLGTVKQAPGPVVGGSSRGIEHRLVRGGRGSPGGRRSRPANSIRSVPLRAPAQRRTPPTAQACRSADEDALPPAEVLESAGALRSLSFISFWAQLALSLTSALVFAFSMAFSGNPSSSGDPTKYLTLVGVVFSFLSTFFAHGFNTLAKKVDKGEVVKRAWVVTSLLRCARQRAGRRTLPAAASRRPPAVAPGSLNRGALKQEIRQGIKQNDAVKIASPCAPLQELDPQLPGHRLHADRAAGRGAPLGRAAGAVGADRGGANQQQQQQRRRRRAQAASCLAGAQAAESACWACAAACRRWAPWWPRAC